MRTIIKYHNPILGWTFKECDLSWSEYDNLRKDVSKTLHESLSWDNHDKCYTHMVISIEDANTRYMYREGLFMTDEEYCRLVANPDIKYVYATHRR